MPKAKHEFCQLLCIAAFLHYILTSMSLGPTFLNFHSCPELFYAEIGERGSQKSSNPSIRMVVHTFQNWYPPKTCFRGRGELQGVRGWSPMYPRVRGKTDSRLSSQYPRKISGICHFWPKIVLKIPSSWNFSKYGTLGADVSMNSKKSWLCPPSNICRIVIKSYLFRHKIVLKLQLLWNFS